MLYNEFVNAAIIVQEVIYRVTPRDYWHYSATHVREDGHRDQNMNFTFKAHLRGKEESEEYISADYQQED
ncbi:MAG: hypothetical protein CL916_05600 [Deltaproteobacteria bacterium]|nr:hypothetical protein [Deltaproteobacteria bacterium]